MTNIEEVPCSLLVTVKCLKQTSLLLFIFLLTSRSSYAQSSVAPTTPSPIKTKQVSYGWSLFATDLAAASVLLGLSKLEKDQGDFAQMVVLTYLGAAPVHHMIRGNYIGAGLSITSRVILPSAAALLVVARSKNKRLSNHEKKNVKIAAMAGIAAATTLDYLLYASMKKEVQEDVLISRIKPQIAVLPQGGFNLGLSGSF